ncbi:Skp family chaperone for outer membrane proteins [Natronocella acetinitrilica]|uniref:Skp family chaperone for outer membrane proteins n=1 Tax=Natronocella acetinitrilica TaxID=414046 RepID=A0AAE3G3B3_9GAMM|nr:hypothetical protein [Natronocella acetinitrilica]MCP1674279.1 Skp family chaperone for outer membrane proteins [Natronocella acetinitrilica]
MASKDDDLDLDGLDELDSSGLGELDELDGLDELGLGDDSDLDSAEGDDPLDASDNDFADDELDAGDDASDDTDDDFDAEDDTDLDEVDFDSPGEGGDDIEDLELEESVADSDGAAKSGSHTGKILAAGGAFMLAMLGGAGYVLFGGGQVPAPAAPYAPTPPPIGAAPSMPSFDDEGMRTPDEGERSATTQSSEVARAEPPMAIDAPVSQSQSIADQLNAGIAPTARSNDPGAPAAPAADSWSAEADLTPVSAPAPAGVTLEQVKSVVSEAVSSEIDRIIEAGNRNAAARPEDSAVLDEIRTVLRRVDGSVSGIEREMERMDTRLTGQFDALADRITALEEAEQHRQNQVAEAAEPTADEMNGSSREESSANELVSSVPAAYYEHLVGRRRLEGFKVINKTGDGTMTVVRTPSARVNVYFVGEVFRIAGDTVTVTDILADGKLVLGRDTRGNRWFIDGILEEPRRQAQRQATSAPAQNQARSESESSRSSDSSARTEGWSLNAVMSSGYLVKDPSGQFIAVSRGDRIADLGEVIGLTDSGGLRVGRHVIGKAR